MHYDRESHLLLLDLKNHLTLEDQKLSVGKLIIKTKPKSRNASRDSFKFEPRKMENIEVCISDLLSNKIYGIIQGVQVRILCRQKERNFA